MEALMSDFKIGDKIRPKNSKAEKLFRSLTGKIVDFLGTPDIQFPIIKNEDGDLLTVNPKSYELSEPQ